MKSQRSHGVEWLATQQAFPTPALYQEHVCKGPAEDSAVLRGQAAGQEAQGRKDPGVLAAASSLLLEGKETHGVNTWLVITWLTQHPWVHRGRGKGRKQGLRGRQRGGPSDETRASLSWRGREIT